MDNLTIEVFQDGNGQWQYLIYGCDPYHVVNDDGQALYGGLCTTTMKNALEMATAQAIAIIERSAHE